MKIYLLSVTIAPTYMGVKIIVSTHLFWQNSGSTLTPHTIFCGICKTYDKPVCINIVRHPVYK